MKTQTELPLAWDVERLVAELPGRPAQLDIRLTADGADLAFAPRPGAGAKTTASGDTAAATADDVIALRLKLTAPVAIEASPRLRWLLQRHDPRCGSWLTFALRLVRRIARVAMAGTVDDPGKSLTRDDPGKSLTRDDDARAALDRALDRTADHLRQRLDRRCWQLAQSFIHLDPLAVYAALVDDRSGRLAQLAECAPGLLTLVLAAPAEIGAPLRAATCAGRSLDQLLDVATELWSRRYLETAPARGRRQTQRLCALQRLRLAGAGSAVGWQQLRTPPVGDFAAADIPFDCEDNASWFTLLDALASCADAFATGSQAPLCRRFARYVSHHHAFFAAAAAAEQWPSLLATLWGFVRASGRMLQLRDLPDQLVADCRAWQRRLDAGDGVQRAPCAPAPIVVPDQDAPGALLPARPLTTWQVLRDESRQMQHGLWRVAMESRPGRHLFLHVEVAGAPFTVELGWLPVAGRYRLIEVCGLANRRPSAAQRAALLTWVAALDTRRLAPRQLQHTPASVVAA